MPRWLSENQNSTPDWNSRLANTATNSVGMAATSEKKNTRLT